ncbi:hypothetical protein GCM10020331_103030 [Ectobacillus funiculus]
MVEGDVDILILPICGHIPYWLLESKKELNDIAMVTSVGVDKVPDEDSYLFLRFKLLSLNRCPLYKEEVEENKLL